MKADKFTKGCFLAIVVLLTMLLIKPLFEAKVAYAAKGVEYKVVSVERECPSARSAGWMAAAPCFEQKLNLNYGKEGWEPIFTIGDLVVFKR